MKTPKEPTTEQLMERYAAIVLWGRQLLSFDYYIENQVWQAYHDGAPEDAVYFDSDGKRWRCVSDFGLDHPFRADYAKFLASKRNS